MSLSLCFHYHNDEHRNIWDQLARTYDVRQCYEIGLPEGVDPGPWVSIGDINDPGLRGDGAQVIFFSPRFAPVMPGVTSLRDFEHPGGNVIYYFGSDVVHSPLVNCDQSVYVDTPRLKSLWSHQAALLVLHDRWEQRGLDGDY